ncbi:MAG: hypothetical protein IKO55_06290 [Kiritimatiellae bacterium]|nr:hypothetical protein [Kiritimatiellia bacterium]
MMGRSIVSTILLYAFSAFAEGGYTNHAGNVVAGWPVKLTQSEVALAEDVVANDSQLSTNACGFSSCQTLDFSTATTYPLSIFPESEQRRIAADFLLRQDFRLRQVDKLRVPLAVKRAISGAEKAIARSRKRAEKGFCTKEECEAFCSQSAAALKRYLDKQLKDGVITPAERRVLALYGVGDCALTTSGCHDNKQGER